MLYCTKCGTLNEDGARACSGCKSPRHMREANEQDFVFLHRADEYTAQRLAGMFDDFSLDYQLKNFTEGRVSYFYDSEVMPTDKNIFVRYRDLPVAKGLSAQLKDELEQEQSGEEQFDDMSKGKRIAVQIVSVIAFLTLIMLVVLGTDSIAGWIKSLFP